jgi:hypothetical protein
MIKDRINTQIRTFTQLIAPTRAGLQKDIFLLTPFALLEQNPGMYPLPRKLIGLNLVRLVIVNRSSQSPPLRVLDFLHLLFLLNVLRHHRVLLLNRELVLLLQLRELVLLEHLALDQPLLTVLVLHPTLVLNRDFLRRLADHHVSVEPHPR